MKEKDKNRITRQEMLRYFDGEMKGRERNAFERRLQKDLFYGEASEGFSGFNGNEISNDLDQLDKRLKSRTSRKNVFTFYRIAASVTVLLVLSSVFIVLNRKNKSEPQVQVVNQPVTLDIPKSKAVIKAEEPPAAEQTDEEITAQNPVQEEPETTVINISTGTAEQPQAMAGAGQRTEAAVSVPAAGTLSDAGFRKNALAREQKQPISDADSAKQAMNDLVMIGYGKAVKDEGIPGNYIAPAPSPGKTVFSNYINSNIRIPASMSEGELEAVILKIQVKSTGAVDTVKVVSSPGKDFSDEAIRLIREGPAWNPAENNGIKIDDEIGIRIIFRK